MVQESSNRPSLGFGEVVRTQWKQMLRLGGFVMLTALSFYIFSTYMSTFLITVVGLEQSSALLSSLMALTFATILAPFMGRLSDRIGRRKMMQMSATLLAVLTIPAYMLAQAGTLASATASQLMISIGAVAANVVTSVLISEMFSTDVRYTASGLSYNVTYAIFGGTAPYIATWLVATTENALAPAIYVSIVAVAALLIVSFTYKETAGKPLRRFHDEPLAD